MTDELNLDKISSNFIKFVKRNFRFIITFIALSVMIVLLFYLFIRPPHFVTTAICKSHITKFEQKNESQRPAVDLINYLQLFIDRDDPAGLGRLLDLSAEICDDFISIEAEQLYQMDLNEEYKNIDKFELTVNLKSNKYYDEIEESFIYYFYNNQYLIDISSAYFSGKEKVYADIVAEISALKALRKTQSISSSAGDFINTEIKGGGAVNEIIYLSQSRESISRDIKTSKLFSYFQPFSKISVPENQVLLWFAVSFLISFFLSLLTAYVRENL
jgi:hypothetical protein